MDAARTTFEVAPLFGSERLFENRREAGRALAADHVVCPHPLDCFFAVGAHYSKFEQVGDDVVTELIAKSRSRQAPLERIRDAAAVAR